MQWNNKDEKNIIGKKIVKVYISDNNESLKFDTEDGDVFFNTEGDCCSKSWINDVVGIKELIGHSVLNVIPLGESEVPPNKDDGDEFIQYYGTRIETDDGECTIAFRNSSNGYYGGWGEFEIDSTGKGWLDISDIDDWSADG